MTAFEALQNANPWSWLVVSIAVVSLWFGYDVVFDLNGFVHSTGSCLHVILFNSTKGALSLATIPRSTLGHVMDSIGGD
jgi:hypothetical protein